MINQAQQARLRMIDFLLDRFGHFRRADLMDYFGLSMPQVSLDIQAYITAVPDNIVYDRSAKSYKKTSTFRRNWP